MRKDNEGGAATNPTVREIPKNIQEQVQQPEVREGEPVSVEDAVDTSTAAIDAETQGTYNTLNTVDTILENSANSADPELQYAPSAEYEQWKYDVRVDVEDSRIQAQEDIAVVAALPTTEAVPDGHIISQFGEVNADSYEEAVNSAPENVQMQPPESGPDVDLSKIEVKPNQSAVPPIPPDSRPIDIAGSPEEKPEIGNLESGENRKDGLLEKQADDPDDLPDATPIVPHEADSKLAESDMEEGRDRTSDRIDAEVANADTSSPKEPEVEQYGPPRPENNTPDNAVPNPSESAAETLDIVAELEKVLTQKVDASKLTDKAERSLLSDIQEAYKNDPDIPSILKYLEKAQLALLPELIKHLGSSEAAPADAVENAEQLSEADFRSGVEKIMLGSVVDIKPEGPFETKLVTMVQRFHKSGKNVDGIIMKINANPNVKLATGNLIKRLNEQNKNMPVESSTKQTVDKSKVQELQEESNAESTPEKDKRDIHNSRILMGIIRNNIIVPNLIPGEVTVLRKVKDALDSNGDFDIKQLNGTDLKCVVQLFEKLEKYKLIPEVKKSLRNQENPAGTAPGTPAEQPVPENKGVKTTAEREVDTGPLSSKTRYRAGREISQTLGELSFGFGSFDRFIDQREAQNLAKVVNYKYEQLGKLKGKLDFAKGEVERLKAEVEELTSKYNAIPKGKELTRAENKLEKRLRVAREQLTLRQDEMMQYDAKYNAAQRQMEKTEAKRNEVADRLIGRFNDKLTLPQQRLAEAVAAEKNTETEIEGLKKLQTKLNKELERITKERKNNKKTVKALQARIDTCEADVNSAEKKLDKQTVRRISLESKVDVLKDKRAVFEDIKKDKEVDHQQHELDEDLDPHAREQADDQQEEDDAIESAEADNDTEDEPEAENREDPAVIEKILRKAESKQSLDYFSSDWRKFIKGEQQYTVDAYIPNLKPKNREQIAAYDALEKKIGDGDIDYGTFEKFLDEVYRINKVDTSSEKAKKIVQEIKDGFKKHLVKNTFNS